MHTHRGVQGCPCPSPQQNESQPAASATFFQVPFLSPCPPHFKASKVSLWGPSPFPHSTASVRGTPAPADEPPKEQGLLRPSLGGECLQSMECVTQCPTARAIFGRGPGFLRIPSPPASESTLGPCRYSGRHNSDSRGTVWQSEVR